MKKFIISILLVLCFFSLSAGSGTDSSSQIDTNGENMEEKLLDYKAYDLDLYVKPFWQGSIVYNESVMFVGKSDRAPLMYKATKIESVTSSDLKKTYVYGEDYLYDEKSNSIYLTGKTTIPYFEEDDYYPSVYITGRTFACNRKDKDFLYFTETPEIIGKQLCVTYRHDGKNMLSAPEKANKAFSKTLAKLKAGEKTKILFYGDSITAGCNSSSTLNCEPYAETWPMMVYKSLVKVYDNTVSEYVNSATGGWSTTNGLENLQQRVIDHAPDLLFVAFGMNDYTLNAGQHIALIREMVKRVREALPDTEICLITPMFPNPEAMGAYAQQPYFEEEYESLMETYRTEGEESVALAKVTFAHREILERKRYYDMTGNNVNHVNDFLARVYAQTILATIGVL